jgi:hypothetical protein
MRHALTAIEAPIFLGSPVALMAPFLKIRLSPFRQEHAPRGLECRSRRLEAWLLCRSSPGSDPEAQRCQTPEKAWPDCHRLADHPGGPRRLSQRKKVTRTRSTKTAVGEIVEKRAKAYAEIEPHLCAVVNLGTIASNLFDCTDRGPSPRGDAGHLKARY